MTWTKDRTERSAGIRRQQQGEEIRMENSLPQQFEEFSQARRDGFLRVKQIKDAGGLIAGIFCTFTPLEILDAAGIIPVSLCGMSNETVPAAEVYLPKNLCPLVKSSYGFAVSDKCPYTYFADLIVGETTCDGKKKMYEMLGNIKDTCILHLPQGMGRDYALEMWARELRRMISLLEEKFHVVVTEEKLRRAARERNAQRRARCRLMELQKLTPPPMRGYQLYKALEGAGFKFYHGEILAALTRLADDVESAYARGECPVDPGAKRILVTGCPIGGVLDKTVRVLEDHGGVAVCFENCSGIKAAFQMVDDTAEDIVTAIAGRYLEIGCSVMTPNPGRMELLTRLCREYRVDGIVEVVLQACHTYNIESWTVRSLAGDLGVPYLGIETDYSAGDAGQLDTRMEAFLEML